MTSTLTLNPLIVVELAAVAQTVVMAFLITIPRGMKFPTRQIAATIEFLKIFGYCTAAVFAVLFLDAGVAWLIGTWGYTDWRYQLPSALLLVVIGVEYIVAGLLKRGNWISIVYVACVAAALLVVFHVLLPGDPVMGQTLENGLPALLGILVGGGVLVAGIEAWRVARRPDRKWRGSWDASPVVDRVFTKWTNLVLWALAVAHGILIFSGYSLLTL